MLTACPNCHQPVRSGARFCAHCGFTVTSPPQPVLPAQPDALDRMRQAVSQAGASTTPAVKDAAAKGWQASRREMGRVAGILTLGGRAAYTEVTNPQPAVEGFVACPPVLAWAGPSQEPAAAIFIAALLAVWLLLLPQPLVGLTVWAGLFVVLLMLAWRGTRRPYFSRLTFRSLWSRLRRRPATVAALTFPVQRQSPQGGPPVTVTVLGYDPAGALAANTYVRVYGIFSADATTLRAWKVVTIDRSGRLAGALTAPRLMPLVVALFLPLVLVLPVLLIRLFT